MHNKIKKKLDIHIICNTRHLLQYQVKWLTVTGVQEFDGQAVYSKHR